MTRLPIGYSGHRFAAAEKRTEKPELGVHTWALGKLTTVSELDVHTAMCGNEDFHIFAPH